MDSGWTVDEEPYFEDEREASKSEYATLRHAVEGPPSLPAYRNAPVKLEPAQSYAPSRPLMFGPNITGSTGSVVGYSGQSASGAFARSDAGDATLQPGRLVTTASISFKASDSSSKYGGASSVQPPSLRLLACIKS